MLYLNRGSNGNRVLRVVMVIGRFDLRLVFKKSNMVNLNEVATLVVGAIDVPRPVGGRGKHIYPVP